MTVGIETRIIAALNAHLVALAIVPIAAISWPNRTFTPPSTVYLRVSILPTRVDALELSTRGPNEYEGLYQVSVFWPVDRGQTAPLEMAAAIAAHFKRGTRLFQEDIPVRIDTPPLIAAPVQEDVRFHIPVTITYRAFVLNP